MKITKSSLQKIILEEMTAELNEFSPGAPPKFGGTSQPPEAVPQPKQKGDVEKISKVIERLPQLKRLFGMINTEAELSQVLDNLISGVSGAKIISAQLLKKVLRAKADAAGDLAAK